MLKLKTKTFGLGPGEIKNLTKLYSTNTEKYKEVINKYKGHIENIDNLIKKELGFDYDASLILPEHSLGKRSWTNENSIISPEYTDSTLKKNIDFEGTK